MTRIRHEKSKQAGLRGECGAKTRGGGTCQRPAGWGTDHPGVGRCKLHGGATPRGVESHRFKHGARCRYLPDPNAVPDVSEHELVSAEQEVRAAVAWAEKLCTDPGPKPPVTVLSALRMVVDLKQRAVELEQSQQHRGPLPPETVADLVGIFTEALVRAELPDHYRERVARGMRLVARERGWE